VEHSLGRDLSRQAMRPLSTFQLTDAFQTSNAITNAIMAAACHPLAQAKVHEELDRYIGSERGNAQIRV
jgi:hypothetical protein